MDPPVLSDPVTRKSGSEFSDPSGLDSNYADPKDTNTKASGPKGSEINQPNPNRVRPQEIRPATLDIGKGTADASRPKPRPEIFDPKHTTLQPFDPQGVKPQASDKYGKPEKAQGSSFEVPRPDDPKADISNTHSFQPNDPADISSNAADSSGQKAKDLPPQDYHPHSSGSDMKDMSSSEPQDVETASSATETPNSLSDQASFKGQDAATSHPNKSPAADPEASGDDASDPKDTHEGTDIFHVLPTKLFSFSEALSPSAKPGDRKHSTPHDPEADPTSRPRILEYPQPGPDPNDSSKTLKGDALAVQFSDEDLPAQRSSAQADLRSMTASAYGSALLSQHPASDPPSASSDEPSRTVTTDASASATVAASISEISGSFSSSASIAATSRRSSGGEFDDGESSQRQSDLNQKKSSGTTLFASKRHPRRIIRTRAQELLYNLCIYILPWLLISL